MPMKEYRCRNCGQVFQVVEIPGEQQSATVECPACQGEDVEPLWAFVHAGTPPTEPLE